VAFYLIDASEQDPEVTRWDSEEAMQRKLEAAAARKAKGG
jgi:hypothetical protein